MGKALRYLRVFPSAWTSSELIELNYVLAPLWQMAPFWSVVQTHSMCTACL